MNTFYPTIDLPATPEYILAVLRDLHRQQCKYDSEADSNITLSFDSTVAEWREACDLLGWRELGRAQNDVWSINITDSEWLSVLEPSHEKPLRGICEIISQHALRPAIRSISLFGCTSRAAGAFLTLRSLLQQKGSWPSRIAPSTPLAYIPH